MPGKNVITHKGVRCYTRQAYRYYADQFPHYTGNVLEQVGIMMSQGIR